jgi:hypothetical protein
MHLGNSPPSSTIGLVFTEVTDVPDLHESDGMMMVIGEAWVDC